ncbi:MAG: HD domain-containing protein [Phycisphaerae bacterium]|nr:HD domain-containing protein [Phycisphaerae bacterium]
MGSSRRSKGIIVDSVHGDITPNEIEWQVLDTASFQRLRHIKQLGMAHFTYPNATHTRFAHSLGVLGTMARVLKISKDKGIDRSEDEIQNIRLAALLHDIGHYPYSHLMERADKTKLAEDIVVGAPKERKQVQPKKEPAYPSHVRLGQLIVTHQDDLIQAVGGKEKAEVVGNLFGRTETAGFQVSKLINSSLDMDRLDYLWRDSNATGVPAGQTDINYLLNNLDVGKDKLLGISSKALPAAEQFLFARYFMHRIVYFHKTTFGFEEACCQLLRRLLDADAGKCGVPRDGNEIELIVKTDRLFEFTDSFLDRIIQQASNDDDEVIAALAKTIVSRHPPKLLKEVPVLYERKYARGAPASHLGSLFLANCRNQLTALAKEHDIHIGRFLVCETPPISLTERSHHMTAAEAEEVPAQEADPDIMVFKEGSDEPTTIVDIDSSMVQKCSDYRFQAFRLYLVHEGLGARVDIEQLREKVKDWDKTSSEV